MCKLYNKIEELCMQNGIKIADLSRETGINKTIFSDLKREKTKFMSVEKLIILADHFDVSLDELVGRKRKTPDTDVSEVSENNSAVAQLLNKRINIMTEEQQALFLSLSEQLIQPKSTD